MGAIVCTSKVCKPCRCLSRNRYCFPVGEDFPGNMAVLLHVGGDGTKFGGDQAPTDGGEVRLYSSDTGTGSLGLSREDLIILSLSHVASGAAPRNSGVCAEKVVLPTARGLTLQEREEGRSPGHGLLYPSQSASQGSRPGA